MIVNIKRKEFNMDEQQLKDLFPASYNIKEDNELLTVFYIKKEGLK